MKNQLLKIVIRKKLTGGRPVFFFSSSKIVCKWAGTIPNAMRVGFSERVKLPCLKMKLRRGVGDNASVGKNIT